MPSNRTLFGELPKDARDSFLFCPKCGARYSATYGDYFWANDNATIVCRGEDERHRPVNMYVAREVCRIVKVA